MSDYVGVYMGFNKEFWISVVLVIALLVEFLEQ